VVLNKNLFRGAIWLIVSLFGVAGLFVLLSAPFLAGVQVLVYIGAIAILITFAVMLTRGMTNLQDRFVRPISSLVVVGLAFAMLVIGVIWPVWGTGGTKADQPVSDIVGETRDLGVALLSGDQYVLPFEVASLLLTAAMIGAIVIARDEE
jgi:NADH-quinone oxidoreductase subunit J